jgi:hypothetical protein
MCETTKGCRIGQNTEVLDKGFSDSWNFGHDKDIFEKLLMKEEFPNQGQHGMLWAKEKDATGCDGKNIFYLLEFEMLFIQLPNK